MKLNIRAEGLYNDDEEERETEESYKLNATVFKNISNQDELTKALEDSVKEILLHIQSLEGRKSNLKFMRILRIVIHFDKYDPTRARSYIELPKFIQLKKTCINIKNKDKCFKYCIQCMIFDKISKHHPEEMFHYNKLNDDMLNWDGVKFPTGNRDIDRFEENNQGLVSVNVYEADDTLNDDKVINVKTTKVKNATHHINLLRVYDENGKHFFCSSEKYKQVIELTKQ